MPTMTISPEFFVNERTRLYPNWQRDFWREFIQNSVDAGSTRINIQVGPTEGDRGCVVVISDNGCGMDLDTIENVYFALGATTKGDGGVGGFGRARILTCFSHPWYIIHTRDNLVNGSGSEYEIKSDDYRAGTSVRVAIDDANSDEMLTALKTFLGYCQLSGVEVSIGGVKYDNWLMRRKKVRELSFGDVHVNKSGSNKGWVFFRVNGQFMFLRYTEANAQVVVEIDPARSREVLSASRGGLMEVYQNEVDSFLAELSVDTRSALRARVDNSRMVLNAGGWLRNEHREEPEEIVDATGIQDDPTVKGSVMALPADATGTCEVVHNENQVAVPTLPEHQVEAAGIRINTEVPDSSFAEIGGDSKEVELPLIDELFNIYILDETDDRSFLRIIDQYDPRNWVHKRQFTKGAWRRYRKGVEHLKLALAWKICCEAALDALLEEYGGVVDWTVGWVFSHDVDAMHRKVDGGHIYMVRPVDMRNKKSAWKLDKRGVIKLLALAAHEVAHTKVDRHDEQYAGVLTDISGRIDQAAVWRRIREEVKGL